MKKITQTIGIDVSRLTLDAFATASGAYEQFANDCKGYQQLIAWARKQGPWKRNLFCFEHTGWYCLLLSYFLYEHGHAYCCVSALEIKRSMGLHRGKSDRADAYQIASYAWLRRDTLIPSIPPSRSLIELQRLMSLREQLVKQRTASKNLYKGMLNIVAVAGSDTAMIILSTSIDQNTKQISTVETAMNTLIRSDEKMKVNFRLSKTVKGVGKILACQMLLHTHNYTRFESCRQFSAYCGIVPYPYQSGTSLRGHNHIHYLSDKKMKSLLTSSAISAVRHDNELKSYYQRRVAEGKPKMVVLNIIRNKIVSRVFATVHRGTPYVG